MDRSVLQSAFTSVLGAGVNLYDSSQSANQLPNSISIQNIFQASYPVVPYMPPPVSSACVPYDISIQVIILPSGRQQPINLSSTKTIRDLKERIRSLEDIPVDKITLIQNGRALTNDSATLSTAGIGNWNNSVYMTVQGPGSMFNFDVSQLDPKFDCDFTKVQGIPGERFMRGGCEYHRPYGWHRLGLRVQGKYENDVWLGPPGPRIDSAPGEWPVSYHGTKRKCVEDIACEGFRIGERAAFGRGVYTTPSIDVVANMYAQEFLHTDGKWYQVAFQNRVNPAFGHRNIIDKFYTRVGADYWVSPCQNVDWGVHDVRPYGILLRQKP